MVKDINKAIGHARLAERLGVSRQAVYKASRKGKWPASWAPIIRDEAARLDPPRLIEDRHFNFKAVADVR